MLKATSNTDASWCPHTGAGGWAAWIALDGGKRVKHSGRFHKLAESSNQAELWAILNGLYLAAMNGAEHVLCQSDCQDALSRVNKRGHWGPDVKQLVKQFPKLRVVRTKWVKGHKLDGSARAWVNDWADKTAKGHMLEQRNLLR